MITWRRVPPSVLAVAFVGIVSLWFRVRSGSGFNGADVDVYLRAGSAVVGGRDVYAHGPEVLPFTYSPFAALLFAPTAWLNQGHAYVLVSALSLLSYAVAVAVVARALGRGAVWASAIGLLGLSFEPVFRTLSLGQVNLVLMALVVVDLLAVPSRYRGWLIGLAAGIKIVPGVFVLVFLLRRQWGCAARAAGGFLVTAFLGGVALPSASWDYWSGGFADMGRFGPPAVPGADNQALAAVWLRLVAEPVAPPAVVAVIGLVALLAAAGASLPHRERGGVALMVCIALGGLLASPVSWTHHWVWCVPVVMLLAAHRQLWWAAGVGGVFWLGPMWVVLAARTSPSALSPLEHVLAASYPVVAIVVWAALAGSRRRASARAIPAPRTSRVGV